MIDLDNAYNRGIAELPSPGKYTVSMRIAGFWQIVLEKSINVLDSGQNHLPVFFLRRFNIPFMDFKVSLDERCNEVIFNYGNGLLFDRLRKRKGENEWIGKMYYRGQFLDYLTLRRK